MDELKACPFCGGEVAQREFTEPFVNGWVGCQKCHCFINWVKNGKHEAITAWNRRAQPNHIGDAAEMVPLTLEELKKGDVVWIKDLVTREIECLLFDRIKLATYHSADDYRFEQFGTDVGIIRWACKYGINWLAYRSKPDKPGAKRNESEAQP